MTTMEIKSFPFQREWLEAIRPLTIEMQGELLRAICEYVCYNRDITLEDGLISPMASTIFLSMKPLIDNDIRRWRNGIKGGAPKGNKNNPNGRRGNDVEEPEYRDDTVPINEPNKYKNQKGKLVEFDYNNVPFGYEDTVKEWVEYKKERGEKYVGQKSFDNMVDKLVQNSNQDPEEAKEIIKRAISGMYKIFVPINKIKTNATVKEDRQQETRRAVSYA